MSSRIRKDRGSSAASEEQQLWQSIRSHLRTLEKLQVTTSDDLVQLEQRRARLVQKGGDDGQPIVVATATAQEKADMSSSYRKMETSLQEEEREVTRALERLEVLLAVREDEGAGVASKTATPGATQAIAGSSSTAITTASGGTEAKRKKRRLEASSLSPPPPLSTSSTAARDRYMSPSSIDGAADNTAIFPSSDRKKSGGAAARRMTGASLGGSEGGGAGSNKDGGAAGGSTAKDGYVDPARARREVLAGQLPLQKGRKVAFRQPSKNKVGPGSANVSTGSVGGRGSTGPGADGMGGGLNGAGASGTGAGASGVDDEGETWIMATVIECINNDRNRYVVQDDEDEGMPTYNTTLKAVVPLPENLNTLPLEDYRVGTQVLGLYPDTSCFYRATVRGGGPGLNGKVTVKMMRRADEVLNTPYQLEFEDDDGAIRDVPANLVVERP